MSEANKTQVGGDHYSATIQHWDFVASNNLDYFQGQITKYVYRWKDKGGLHDLLKARHFLDKYIELNSKQDMVAPAQRGAPPNGKVTLNCTCGKDLFDPCPIHRVDVA